jgi:formamidase
LILEGDGEISFCGAIEMAGIITLKFSVMKNGMADLGMKSPIFHQGPVEPQFGPGRYLTFEGFSVDENGKQHYMDATVAYRQTTLRVIEYLRRFGYDDYQIYLLLSCAPVQGHIAGIVDVSFFRSFVDLCLGRWLALSVGYLMGHVSAD